MNSNLKPKCAAKTWCQVIPEFDFTSRYRELGTFDYIVNFEVIEHMEVDDGRRLLLAMAACLKDDGTLILSTPVLGRKPAKNHIHEYEIAELAALIDECGLVVVERFGTFASYPDIVKAISNEEREILERVRKFYGDDVTSCFFAPLYPDESRNNVWVISKKTTSIG